MRGRNGRKLTQSIKPKKKNKKGHTQAKARETVEAVEAVEVIEDVMGEELIEGETALLRAGTNPATCTQTATVLTCSTYPPPHPAPAPAVKRVVDDAHAVLTMDDHETVQLIIDEYSDQALWGWAPSLNEENEERVRKPTWRGHVPWAPVFMKELAALCRA